MMFETHELKRPAYSGHPALYLLGTILLALVILASLIRFGMRYTTAPSIAFLAIDGLATLVVLARLFARKSQPQSAFRLLLICFGAVEIVHLLLL